MLFIRRLKGGSMRPGLKEGQFLIFRSGRPALKRIVLAQTEAGEVVKRITAKDGELVFLSGDHHQSSSYCLFEKQLKGLLWFKI